MTSPIDHLIFGTPNLHKSVKELEAMLGVSAIIGGSHPGLGTSNALIALGPQCYLEIMGPDPAQPDFHGTRPFGIDDLERGQLVGWVARREDLDQFRQNLKLSQIELAESLPVSRQATTGELLEWEMTYLTNAAPQAFSVMPFFIDWGSTPHPELACRKGARLIKLEIEYPIPSEIEPLVDALELDVSIREASQAGIRALIECPQGEIELSSPSKD